VDVIDQAIDLRRLEMAAVGRHLDGSAVQVEARDAALLQAARSAVEDPLGDLGVVPRQVREVLAVQGGM